MACRCVCCCCECCAGKSSVARELSALLDLPVLDIDDDVLERQWGQSVADKLRQLGDDDFLKAEAAELKTVNVERTVISLSGSARTAALTRTTHSKTWHGEQPECYEAHCTFTWMLCVPAPILSTSMRCPTLSRMPSWCTSTVLQSDSLPLAPISLLPLYR